MKNCLVVTRHHALVDYLKEKGYVKDDVEVVSHVTPELVTGRHVIGVLPHSLSCLTESFTEVVLDLPPHKRGQELSLKDIREYSKGLVTYKVAKAFRHIY